MRVRGPERRGQLGAHVIKVTNLFWHSSYSGNAWTSIRKKERIIVCDPCLEGASGYSEGLILRTNTTRWHVNLRDTRNLTICESCRISLSAIYKSRDLNLKRKLRKAALSLRLYSLEVAFIWWKTWSRKIIWLNVEVSLIRPSVDVSLYRWLTIYEKETRKSSLKGNVLQTKCVPVLHAPCVHTVIWRLHRFCHSFLNFCWLFSCKSEKKTQ